MRWNLICSKDAYLLAESNYQNSLPRNYPRFEKVRSKGRAIIDARNATRSFGIPHNARKKAAACASRPTLLWIWLVHIATLISLAQDQILNRALVRNQVCTLPIRWFWSPSKWELTVDLFQIGHVSKVERCSGQSCCRFWVATAFSFSSFLEKPITFTRE